jgi:hypothetical protein
LVRNGNTAPINYIKFKTNALGQNYFWVPIKNILWQVYFYWNDGKNEIKYISATGGVASAYSTINAKNIKVVFDEVFSFSGVELGIFTTTGTTILTNCINDYYGCSFTEMDPGTFICSSTMNMDGTNQGACTLTGTNCRPTTLTGAFYGFGISMSGVLDLTNQSGAVIWLRYDQEDIFACNETGLSVALCPFIIIKNIWWKFTIFINTNLDLIYSITSIASPTGTGKLINYNFIPTANAEDLGLWLKAPYFESASGVVNSNVWYTGTEAGGLNKAIYGMGDQVKNLPAGGLKWIFAVSQWTLILVAITFVIWFIILSIKS